MKRTRQNQAALNLPTLTLEGGLFLPDQLEKAALGRAQWQTEADYGTPKTTCETLVAGWIMLLTQRW